MVSLVDGGKISNISLFVLAQLRNVTDRQTDEHRAYSIYRAYAYASRGKNVSAERVWTPREFQTVGAAAQNALAANDIVAGCC